MNAYFLKSSRKTIITSSPTMAPNAFGRKNGKVNKVKKESSGVIREFIAKLSRGLMLPIAMLPIAGLFLGIGSAIATQGDHYSIEWLRIMGTIIKSPGDVIFGNLPVLFCIAIAITFTKDAGTAALSAFVGWVVFCAFQSALIVTNGDTHTFMGFMHFDNDQYNSIFTTNCGITSLSTSVFGGILVGSLVAVLYNKFKDIQLPQIVGFFSGVRFIPIITFISSIGLSLIFCLLWPWVGQGLFYFGKYIGGAPGGVNSLVFGYMERALVPFGLHHAFYAPLWYTSAGGDMDLTKVVEVWTNGHKVEILDRTTWQELANWSGKTITGDQSCWMFANSLVGKQIDLVGGGKYTITFDTFKYSFTGVNVGQYMQGKYSFMMFGLPAAAFAMVMVVPKGENRKIASSIILAAALTSFLTGITEPLEFTFIFLAPALYYGFHAVLCAVSFWLMNLLGAHMGMTFSGGVIDFVIYGIIPDIVGGKANCWIAVIIGACYAPIYYFGFFFAIKKFNIKTPGREGAEIKLFTKQDFLKAKGSKSSSGHDQLALSVIDAYGGLANIKNVDACITKLRIQVVDQSKVDKDKLMGLGARGVIKPSSQSVYAIFGVKADFIKNKINEVINDKKTV